MKIAIIGAGAMGSVYGGRLSQKNEVYLIDTNEVLVDKINESGLILNQDDVEHLFHPKATVDSSRMKPVDLILVFVKAFHTRSALMAHQTLIGEHTYILTLQNGAGHEEILSEFVPKERIVIGTTEDNGTVRKPGYVRCGGTGRTNIGSIGNQETDILSKIKSTFDSCGFDVVIHENIQQLIWDKLFINSSLSVLTGILQVPIGFIGTNSYAWKMACKLIMESTAVARAMGLMADEIEVQKKVKAVIENSPEGITSICADLKNNRKTEIDTISNAVVMAAKQLGVEAPTHVLMVDLVHAMEART